MQRRLTVALMLPLLLSACATRGPTPVPPGADTPSPPAPPPATAGARAETPGQVKRGPDTAAGLFPTDPRTVTFTVRDYDQPAKQVRESLVPLDNTVVAATGETPYAAWIIRPDGVWRRDPKGAVLLRYLPTVLEDGATWEQASGSATVSFRLAKDRCIYGQLGNPLPPGDCWSVTVQNRQERTTYWFVPTVGPTAALSVNYAEPAASFYKEIVTAQPLERTASQVTGLAGKLPQVADSAPAPTAISAAAFSGALDHYPGVQSVSADLDGDGEPERVRGVLNGWTPAPVEVFRADGTLLPPLLADPGHGHRISLLPAPTFRRTVLLVQEHTDQHSDSITIMAGWRDEQGLHVEATGGWDVKSSGTIASRVSESGGVITVAWDLGDPARHTRTRTYSLQESHGRLYVQMSTERYVPQDGDLVYPTTPLDVLQAAFNTRWLNLPDETARYFATPAAVQAFAARKEITQPDYGPGDVHFRVTQQSDHCSLQAEPATLQADNTASFLAAWGGYEWGAGAWGTVTFGQDSRGHAVIERIDWGGTCASYE